DAAVRHEALLAAVEGIEKARDVIRGSRPADPVELERARIYLHLVEQRRIGDVIVRCLADPSPSVWFAAAGAVASLGLPATTADLLALFFKDPMYILAPTRALRDRNEPEI